MLNLMGLLRKGTLFPTDGKWKNLKDILCSVNSKGAIQMMLLLGGNMLRT